ncbi:MAG: Gfo/Idh/MocA family oxidoreductase [Chitinophagaceae bacterium]
MNQQVNVGIIGYGLAGRVFHTPLIAGIPGFRIAKIVTTDPSRMAAVEERYPGTQIVSDADSIFKDENISLVIVASPNEFHYEHSRQALLHNKHVVSDKPFTVTSAEADELIEIARKKKLLLTAFQNRRWDSDFLTIKKLIGSGRLGTIVEAEIHFDRFKNFIKPNNWKEESRPGTGIHFDLGIHLVDQAQELFGLPGSITGFLLKQRNLGQTIDNFEILLHYPQLKVTLKTGLLVRVPLPKYIITGQSGTFVKYGMDMQEAQLDSGMKPGDILYGTESEAYFGKLYYESDNKPVIETIGSECGNYSAFYQNVFSAIVDGEKLLVDPVEARNNIRMIELAVLSSEEKRTLDFV